MNSPENVAGYAIIGGPGELAVVKRVAGLAVLDVLALPLALVVLAVL